MANTERTDTVPYTTGYALGLKNAPYGNKPNAVSIPTAYLGGDLPKAWDGWAVAAHEYAQGYLDGWEAGQAPTETD